MMMSTETEGNEIVKGAEAIEGLVMEYHEHAEGMEERDALSLMMSTETEGAEMVKVLDAMDGLVMEEDYEHTEGMEQDALSLMEAIAYLVTTFRFGGGENYGRMVLVACSKYHHFSYMILLRIAVYTITYTTSIFPEKYFDDKFVPELDMIVKELVALNEESEMLVDWMEEGVYDSVKGKYLKTLLFSTCEQNEGQEIEECAFSFSYSSKRIGELAVKLSWIGSNTEILTLKLHEGELAPERMRSSACKLIRMCALCTTMLEEMKEGVKATKYDFTFENINWSPQNQLDDAGDSYDSEEFSKTTNGFLFFAASRRYPFHLDSGASYHVCGTRECLHNFKRLKTPIALNSVEENELVACRRGDIVHQDVKLKGVLFVPRIKFSVVSVGLLDKQGRMTCIGDGRFTVYNVDTPALVGYGLLNRVDKDYSFCSMEWLKAGNCEGMDEEENELDEDEDEGWIVDSLCANHMVGDKTLLSDCVRVRREFKTASGVIVCTLKGSVRTAKVVLNDVLYCKDIGRKLISVSQLDEKGFMFTFYKRRCQIQLRDPIHSSGYALMNSRTNHYIICEFSEKRSTPKPELTPSPKKRRRGGSKKRNRN